MNKEIEIKTRYNFEQTLNEFDFKTVYSVMDYLSWYWHGKNRAPNPMEMIETVEELFEYAIKEIKDSDYYASSGGFLVRIYPSGKVEIQFILEESEFPFGE